MDYQRKYLKYKAKYFNLLGGMVKKFYVKKNNGSDGSGRYSNQCMWLSILDYLNGVMDNNLNLDEIRAIGSRNNTGINDVREQYDTDFHYQSLLNVVETFDLQIHFYVVIRDRNSNSFISNRPNMIVGEISSSNVVSIVSYGSHFELITSIGDHQLYEGKINFSDKFSPNRELALGKKINNVNKLSHIQLARIDELLEISVNFNRVILDLKQNLELNQSRLDELEKSFIMDEKNINLSNEEIQIAMISSFQEHKLFLEKTINEIKTELDGMKRDTETFEKELDVLVSK